ncbi:MAG: hypothetical protein HY300_06260 [Verrucomicrobia bacterium]|nr:hypothetical protein [Verrucomicrobiota bacterium]
MTAVLAYATFYLAGTAPQREWLGSNQPELAWLKHEFNLNDSEFARISRLHETYVPECKIRCKPIEKLNIELSRKISATTELTPEIEAMLAERARLRAVCQTEMLRHFFEVSRTMPPEEGRRYLAWVQKQTCINEQTMNPGEPGHN